MGVYINTGMYTHARTHTHAHTYIYIYICIHIHISYIIYTYVNSPIPPPTSHPTRSQMGSRECKNHKKFGFAVDHSVPKYGRAGSHNGVIWCQPVLSSGPMPPSCPLPAGLWYWAPQKPVMGRVLDVPFCTSERCPGPRCVAMELAPEQCSSEHCKLLVYI